MNRRALLAEAVESVRAQHWPEVEHLVVDGGSSDGTIEWVERQPDLVLVRGPDRGVYDAMNKGIAQARGDVVGLLNSDDLYRPGAFASAADAFAGQPLAAAVCGRALLVEDGAMAKRLTEPIAGDDALRAAFLGACLPNARFFRREALARLGGFRLDWPLVADRDLVVRLLKSGAACAPVDADFYAYRCHAGSLTFQRDRCQALGLRRDLLSLARHWVRHPEAGGAARRFARILEGRSRIGLVRDGGRALGLAGLLAVLARSDGRLSLSPAISMVRALVDFAVVGKGVGGKLPAGTEGP